MNSSEKKSEKKILNRKFIEQLLDNRRNHKPNRTLCTRLMIARTFCKSIRRINMMTIKLFFFCSSSRHLKCTLFWIAFGSVHFDSKRPLNRHVRWKDTFNCWSRNVRLYLSWFRIWYPLSNERYALKVGQ